MDYDNLIKEWGISKSLGEHPEAGARIYNDFSKYNWIIHIHPSNVLPPYFKIYKDCLFPGKYSGWSARYCTRISMLSPEYIQCNDCTMTSWILNEDERNHLCEIVKGRWQFLLSSYADELEWYIGEPHPEIMQLKMPDYTKLPIKEG